MMAPHFDTVDGFDLSPVLIEQAARAASEAGLDHVRFEVGDVAETGRRRGRFDVVACTGVLSTIVDEWLVLEVMRGLRRRLNRGGMLLLRDSLSTVPEGQLVASDSYATRYHYDRWYHESVQRTGLRMRAEFPLAEFGSCTNRFFLYQLER
jgi:chemotaxis methyl-accepting protein methylase